MYPRERIYNAEHISRDFMKPAPSRLAARARARSAYPIKFSVTMIKQNVRPKDLRSFYIIFRALYKLGVGIASVVHDAKKRRYYC